MDDERAGAEVFRTLGERWLVGPSGRLAVERLPDRSVRLTWYPDGEHYATQQSLPAWFHERWFHERDYADLDEATVARLLDDGVRIVRQPPA